MILLLAHAVTISVTMTTAKPDTCPRSSRHRNNNARTFGRLMP